MAPPRLKQRSYAVFYLLATAALIIVIRWWLGNMFADPYAAPQKLTDGKYYIDEVTDSVSFLVTPVQSDVNIVKSFRVRLAGVKNKDYEKSAIARSARLFIEEFVRAADGQRLIVRLQFDRYRLDSNDTALAYLWIKDRILNVELARAGFVLPDNIVGNSPSIQRKIKLASEEARENGVGIFSGAQ